MNDQKSQAPDSLAPPFDDKNSNYKATWVTKYRTTVTIIRDEKDNNIIIDSGGTHIVFHSKDSFRTYKNIAEDSAHAAFRSTHIL